MTARAFWLRMHIGNHSLFLSGVFPERIRFRAESRGFPDIKYYEQLGRTHYRIAGEHRLAQRYHLEGILKTLAERFQATRRALNDMADRVLRSVIPTTRCTPCCSEPAITETPPPGRQP